MIVSYNRLLKLIESEGLAVVSKKVKKVALGIFEPIENASLSFSLRNKLDIKPFLAQLQKVPIYVDGNNRFILGSQSLPLDDSLNSHFPGEFNYGGAFVIEDLINKKSLALKIDGYSTDLHSQQNYKKNINFSDLASADITLKTFSNKKNEAYINNTDKILFTNLGVSNANKQNVIYRSSGLIQVLGEVYNSIDSIFLGGNKASTMKLSDNSLMISGDFLKMDTLYISGLSLKGYGVYLGIGLGAIISLDKPEVLDIILANEEKKYTVIDIGTKTQIAQTSLKSLRKPTVKIDKKIIKTGALTSFYLSEKIAERMIRLYDVK